MKRHLQTGSSLIEVLVSALILAFGMLALVSMQGSASQLGKIAQFRGDASRLAVDFAERVRANPTVLNSYLINTPYGGNPAVQAVPNNCSGAVACTPAQIAAIDVAEMLEAARTGLPRGAFYVTTQNVGAGASVVLNVWVLWQTATSRSDASNTTEGQGCPNGVVTAAAGRTECILSRFVL